MCHLVSGAAHKHLVIILAGSPVASEYTECTTHGDAQWPSNVSHAFLCGFTSLQHIHTHTHTHTHKCTQTPFFYLSPSGCVMVQLKVGGNLRLTVTEAKGNRIFLPHKHSAAQRTNSFNTTGNDTEKPELPLSECVSVWQLTDVSTDKPHFGPFHQRPGSIFNTAATLNTQEQGDSVCRGKIIPLIICVQALRPALIFQLNK